MKINNHHKNKFKISSNLIIHHYNLISNYSNNSFIQIWIQATAIQARIKLNQRNYNNFNKLIYHSCNNFSLIKVSKMILIKVVYNNNSNTNNC